MAVKGLIDVGFGTTGGLLSSLDYAIEHGANLSSNSWDSSESATTREKMWSNILENNPHHLFVAAAGNDNLMVDAECSKRGRGQRTDQS